ncbi:hypothetical protein C8D97_11394 [Pleionea mediterranea]|uniref:Uncharacterized protein n=1 Tax=Pleionea mediterranea TaxID=523701 RepID=A0A316FDC5_9GAMM|nr:hypothetical protein C8D97_11394 [Pleionea mediterranea]
MSVRVPFSKAVNAGAINCQEKWVASGRNPDDKVGNDFLRKTQSQKRFASLRLHASSFFQELKKEPKKPLSVTTGVFDLSVYRSQSNPETLSVDIVLLTRGI